MKSEINRTKSLEKKEDALSRLKSNTERHNRIKQIKSDIILKSGLEHTFKIYSTKLQNNNLIKIRKNVSELKKEFLFIKNEIKRSKFKLKKYLHEPTGVRILYEGEKEDNFIDFSGSNKVVDQYNKYIDKLEVYLNNLNKEIEYLEKK